ERPRPGASCETPQRPDCGSVGAFQAGDCGAAGTRRLRLWPNPGNRRARPADPGGDPALRARSQAAGHRQDFGAPYARADCAERPSARVEAVHLTECRWRGNVAVQRRTMTCPKAIGFRISTSRIRTAFRLTGRRRTQVTRNLAPSFWRAPA